MKKQLYNRYPINATNAVIIKYHKTTGMNLEIRNTERMIHKQPA